MTEPEESVNWLFCWTKTGMGSRPAAKEAQRVFDAILPVILGTLAIWLSINTRGHTDMSAMATLRQLTMPVTSAQFWSDPPETGASPAGLTIVGFRTPPLPPAVLFAPHLHCNHYRLQAFA